MSTPATFLLAGYLVAVIEISITDERRGFTEKDGQRPYYSKIQNCGASETWEEHGALSVFRAAKTTASWFLKSGWGAGALSPKLCRVTEVPSL